MIGLDVGRRSRPSNLSLAQHINLIGKIGGKVKAFLHQQDSETFVFERAQPFPDVLDDNRRESLGGLVENEQLGAIASICCSPPDNRLAPLVERCSS